MTTRCLGGSVVAGCRGAASLARARSIQLGKLTCCGEGGGWPGAAGVFGSWFLYVTLVCWVATVGVWLYRMNEARSVARCSVARCSVASVERCFVACSLIASVAR